MGAPSVKLFTLIGNVASGKSTAVPLVSQALKATAVQADEFFQVSPFRDDFLRDIEHWGLANELWVTEKRATLMDNTLKGGGRFVVDSGLPMSWVYARSHSLTGLMTREEWELYETLFGRLAGRTLEETVIILLICPLPTLLSRISHRARDYELRHYGKAYLTQLAGGISAFCDTFRTKVAGIVTVTDDETGDLPSVETDKTRFMNVIKKKLSGYL